ncbi:TetR/AcrR family transcriptional regulator [Curtobacterium sp. MCBD17_034]|nr:TetR/AcrR family transcriptional regulator [Curtobacterium sp. MCBD17_034]PZM32988.1 TetR/AcrR family transcriptional regulator [Curtobacterium sp. MCBD17_031]
MIDAGPRSSRTGGARAQRSSLPSGAHRTPHTMTPPPLNTTILERQLRSRLLSSADRLFDRSGFGPVSVGRIARDADLPLETLRREFPTKHQLVVAVMEARHRSWVADLTAAVSVFTDPRDQILAVFSYLEATFRQRSYRGCAFINGYGELGRRNADVAQLADEHLTWFERYLAELCDRAGLPGHLAHAVSLLAEGAQVEAAIHGSVRPASSARSAAAMLIAVYTVEGH